ncbi:MerR family transcriptional regulator [Streptomyces seoulensis]|uniref:MerR family transcriptional regulator n=1 Tax=Streptomyces seoulensis TaxID=73044 RepID=A0A4P6TUE8_STRSO|nr:MerR family transcriptional regulator [Streptomyces seoulensis]QBJ89088.1 MerR family transcriptional regulator [Streptomyces seoulensis]
MLIGELARRSGVSERLLRHYERVELIHSERRANGYREYDDPTVETVRRVRVLLAAGLPTRIIRQILPCTTDEAALRPCPGVLSSLRDQLSVLDQRAADLETARHLLRRTIAATENAMHPASATRSPQGPGPDAGGPAN